MKLKAILATVLFCMLFTACIQNEPLNAEADILTCIVPDDIKKTDPQISNTKVTILTILGTDLKALAPLFTITPGATITPASGTVRNFETPQTYTVTSEDGMWKKEYTVTFNVDTLPQIYNFEHWKLDKPLPLGKYHEFYELSNGMEQRIWASGNPAFSILAGNRPAEEYPTSSCNDGISGKGLKLQTLTTGEFGSSVRMPIAAGNLFLGTFDSNSAITNALGATRFGLPFEKEPLRLEGYYKYTSGPVFTDREKNVIPERKDTADIYAVFYETDENVKTLDGNNVLTSPNIISIARIDKPGEPDKYTFFSEPFIMKPGKTIDKDKLKHNGYNIAIVFSSSREGAYFRGAVGSTLIVDQIVLITEDQLIK